MRYGSEDMILGRFIADKERKAFIRNATRNDRIRMASEVLPGNCDAECDIVYETPDIPEHRLDIYKLNGTTQGDTVFFLIHGGAFVYGTKELDKNFGMNLAVFSQLPVVNVNYHLMPEKSLSEMLNDLCMAIDYISKNRGVNRIHLVGDSAGGYLAVMLACLLRDKGVRHDLGVFVKSDVEVLSVASICGVYEGDIRKFPAIYFVKPAGISGGDIDIPDYIFDLKKVIKRTGLPRTCLITGDKDFLRKGNAKMRDYLQESGIPVKFYDAISSEDKSAIHVFPISDPAWQESHVALKLIIENAAG
ncbi:MAG: alpha/beta hydrolase [Clostridiales bacterium]|nr:alpha/beta hydrolase [Clostridiales bacterium]